MSGQWRTAMSCTRKCSSEEPFAKCHLDQAGVLGNETLPLAGLSKGHAVQASACTTFDQSEPSLSVQCLPALLSKVSENLGQSSRM